MYYPPRLAVNIILYDHTIYMYLLRILCTYYLYICTYMYEYLHPNCWYNRPHAWLHARTLRSARPNDCHNDTLTFKLLSYNASSKREEKQRQRRREIKIAYYIIMHNTYNNVKDYGRMCKMENTRNCVVRRLSEISASCARFVQRAVVYLLDVNRKA